MSSYSPWAVKINPFAQPHPATEPLHLTASLAERNGAVLGCETGTAPPADWTFAWQAHEAGRPLATSMDEFQGLAAVLTAFPSSELTISISALHVPTGIETHDTVALRLNHRPQPPAVPFSVTAAASPITADMTHITLSTPGAQWRPSWPGGWPLEFRFVVRASGGHYVSLPAPYDAFGPASVVLPAPWLPGEDAEAGQAAAPSNTTASQPHAPERYSFAVYVRDRVGMEAGPFEAPHALVVQPPPACRPSCDAADAPVPHAACLACGGRPLPRNLSRTLAARLAAACVRDPRAVPWLLRDVAFLAHRLPPDSPPFEAPHARLRLAERLLSCRGPHFNASIPSPSVLQDALGPVLYAGARAPVPHGIAGAYVGFVSEAARALWAVRAAQCAPQPLRLQSPPLHLSAQRSPASGLPAALAIGRATAHLPPTLGLTLSAGLSGNATDLVVGLLPPPEGLLVEVVSLSFLDATSGAEVPVADLDDPISIVWPLEDAHTLRLPLADWYRCVWEDAGSWRPDGVYLSAAPSPVGVSASSTPSPPPTPTALACHTSHLSAFSIQPVPRVTSVSGCGHPAPPRAMFCAAHFAALTISGGHFGPDGAVVDLVAPGTGHRWRCGTVTPTPGRADEELVCLQPRWPLSPDVGEGGEWVDVQVTTRYGTSHTLVAALHFAGHPRVTALVPVGLASCVARAPAVLTQCPAVGTRFGVRGVALLGYGATTVAVGPYNCPEVIPHNTTYIECRGLSGKGPDHAVRITVGHGSAAAVALAWLPLSLSFVTPCAAKPGHWVGSACDACHPGYYGRACDAQCPGASGNASANASACSGHGMCDDGVAGNGVCLCYVDSARGHWAGAACERCHTDYAGPGCRTRCPTADPYSLGLNVTCAGHGACDALGRCTCTRPYAGAACTMRCPTDDRLNPCSGHGACVAGPVAGAGLCQCMGTWAGAVCSQCAAGWVGPTCTHRCPGLPVSLCGGEGECHWSGAGAVCHCGPRFVGGNCSLACPADAAGRVCGGHGTCEAGGAAAVCACAPHWAGPLCAACATGFVGVDCAWPCPRGPGGAVCSGRGRCEGAGVCVCEGGACGPVCETDSAECAAAPCPDGRYGRDCEGACACGPQGQCQAGRFGTGACLCSRGWAGLQCQVPCGGSEAGPVCGGHGTCHALSGACGCDARWRTVGGSVCAVRCPPADGVPCSGHGACTAAAACTCEPGYGGADCARRCPADSTGPTQGTGLVPFAARARPGTSGRPVRGRACAVSRSRITACAPTGTWGRTAAASVRAARRIPVRGMAGATAGVAMGATRACVRRGTPGARATASARAAPTGRHAVATACALARGSVAAWTPRRGTGPARRAACAVGPTSGLHVYWSALRRAALSAVVMGRALTWAAVRATATWREGTGWALCA